MPTLLDGVVTNTVGTAKKVYGPAEIFVEGDLGGGTITVLASRASGSEEVVVATITDEGVFIDAINGVHYLSATLAGSTSPDCTVVVT